MKIKNDYDRLFTTLFVKMMRKTQPLLSSYCRQKKKDKQSRKTADFFFLTNATQTEQWSRKENCTYRQYLLVGAIYVVFLCD